MMVKNKKRIVQVLIASLALWIVALALAPTVFSKPLLKSYLRKKTAAEVSFSRASLSWFGSQSVENLSLKQKGLDLHIKEIHTSASLFSLLFSPKNFKDTSLEGLSGSYLIQESGPLLSLNSETPKASQANEKPSFVILKLPLIGKLNIDHSNFTFLSNEYDPIVLSEIQLNCSRSDKNSPIFCNLACETTQNELSGSVLFNMEMGGLDPEGKLILTPFDQDIFFLSPKGYLQLKAELTNLPTSGLDHLAALNHSKLEGLFNPLLGDSVNLGAQVNMIKGKSALNLCANAPTLDLKFSGSLVQKEFCLDEASICTLSITPAFAKALSAHLPTPIEISKSCPSSIHLDRLTLPLDFKNFNFKALSCNAQFEMGEAEFCGDSAISGLKLQNLKGVIDTFDIGENVSFHVKALAEDQKQPALLKADGQISKLVDLQEPSGLEQLSGNFQIELKDAPSRAVALFTQSSDFTQQLLGPTTSLNLKFKGSAKNGNLTLQLNSSRLSVPQTAFTLEEKTKLSLVAPAHLTYKLNPSFAKLVLNPKLKLLHPVDVTGKLKKLDLDFTEKSKSLEDVDLKVSFATFEASYENSTPLQIQETKVYLNKNEEKKMEAKAYFTAVLPKELQGLAVGKLLDFSLIFSNFSVFENQENVDVLGQVKGEALSINFDGYISPTLSFNLSEGSLLAHPFKYKEFTATAPSAIKIHPLTFSLKKFALMEEKLSGDYTSNEVTFKGANFKDCVAHFEWSPSKKTLNLNASSGKDQHTLSASITNLSLSDPSTFSYQAYAHFRELPSTSFDKFAAEHHLPKPSSSVDLKLESSGSPSDEIYCKYKLLCDNLKTHGAFTLGHAIYLNEPIEMDCTLSKSDLKRVIPGANVAKPARVLLTINRLHKERGASSKIPEVFEGELACEKLVFEQGQLSHIQGHFETPNIQEMVKVELKGRTLSSTNQAGEFSIKGDLIEPLDSLKTGHYICSLHHCPSQLIKEISPLGIYSPYLEATGPLFDLEASMKWVCGLGSVVIDYQSNLAKASGQFQIGNEALTLKDDLNINLRVSTELAKWMGQINPVYFASRDSDGSISLTIEKEGFKIPLKTSGIEGVEIAKAAVGSTSFRMHPSDTLGPLLQFIDAEESGSIACLAEQSFSLKEGKITLSPYLAEFDDSPAVSIWGHRDLQNHTQEYFVALPGEALTEIFDLPNLTAESALEFRLSDRNSFKRTKAHLEMLASNSKLTMREIEEGLADANPTLHVSADQTPREERDHESASSVLNQFLKEAKKRWLP